MPELTPEQKKKRRKIIIIVVIVLLLLAGAVTTVILLKRSKDKKALKEAADKAKQQQQPPPKTASANGDNFPLVEGSKGENVLYLQRALNRMVPVGYDKLVEDSDFGHKTYLAVVTWMGTRFYPVTQENWTEILKKSNNYGQSTPRKAA